MNFKFEIAIYFLFSLFVTLLTFAFLNLLEKKVYLLSTLEFKSVVKVNEFQQPQRCQIVLNGKQQPINIANAVDQIEEIVSFDQKGRLNLKKHPLKGENDNFITIQDFQNDCQGFSRNILVLVGKTTLWHYLFNQIGIF